MSPIMAQQNGEDLPEECWELIFKHLEHKHLESVSLACKRFLSISNRLRFDLLIPDPLAAVPGRVSAICKRFHQLKRIHLVGPLGNLDFIIIQISESGLKLESLDISRQKRFPASSMRVLGRNNKTLRSLNCSRLQLLQDSDLDVIANSFPLLEELDISYPEQDLGSAASFSAVASNLFPGTVTDVGIEELSFKLRNLEAINLSGNHFISDDSLIAISSNCVFLSRLSVLDCSFLSHRGLEFAVNNCQNLISLSVNGSSIAFSRVTNFLAYARALQCLNLSQMVIQDDLLFCIRDANLPLRKLVLAQCQGFTFSGISGLLECYRNLNHLDLEDANFLTDEFMAELVQNLHNLRFFSLNSCCRLTNASFFYVLRSCSSLEELQMERTSLGFGVFQTNFQWKNRINSLKLAWNKSLNDETLKEIGFVCSGLRSLDISHCWCFTEEGVRAIGKSCPEITELRVNGCRVRNLGGVPGFAKLGVLQASNSLIEDEGLSMVGKSCRELLTLNVEGCLGVTDRGLKEVASFCTKLRKVNLRECAINVDLLAWMVFHRPSLRKIITSAGFDASEKQRRLLLRHGCLVCHD